MKADINEIVAEIDKDKPDVVMMVLASNDGWSKGMMWAKKEANMERLVELVKDVLDAYSGKEETVH